MTKEEAISKTEYSESELMQMALAIGMLRLKEWRNQSQDSASWDHYENIRQAMQEMRNELMEKKGA